MSSSSQAPLAQGARDAEQPAQYLTFVLGGEVFGFAILAVKEIIEYGTISTVPMMPACVRGVINLRGAVVPVMDLSMRFGRPSSPVGRRTCIVIVEVDGGDACYDVGVIVDAVNAVQDILPSQIEPPPSFGTRLRADFIQGIGKVNGQFVILLNVGRTLSADEISALAGGAARAAVEAVAA